MRFSLQSVTWFLVVWLVVTPANAGFIAAAFGAFAATTIGGIVVNAVIGIALSIGASLLQGLFTKKTDTKDPGTTLNLRVGGDNPLFFPMGRCATAGVRIYTGTYTGGIFGILGGTPNEYAVDVLVVSTMPLAPGARPLGVWFNDQKITIRYDLPKTAQGWPVQEYFKDDKYWAWVDFHDGNQTVADDYLLARFGSNPDYPWLGDMVGRGVAYLTVTCRYDKDGLWQSGFPSVLTELPSVPLYDPRLDSTNGGSGPQRWADRSTWQPSNNAMVRAYNIARGVYYGGEWVYGGQNWPAFRLPASSWFAAMNACDLVVDGEPQFHGGGIVEGDVEPAASIEELLRSSSGLISENGGIYKVRVGAPGAPVYGFTDDNIVVTREQGYEPFPGLENTFNIVRLSYTEPVERWANKESPERRDAALITTDDNRELPMSVQLPWVLSNLTAQRIGRTALYNGRRFRKHNYFLGPIAWLLEPLDVVSWTSAHNQYVNKSFDLEQISGNSSFLQALVVREVDPSDYNWNPATDALPYQTIPLVPQFPVAQPMTGWQVFPDAIYDEQGRARRPTIRVHYAANLSDIDRVQVQVRPAGSLAIQFDGEVPYDAVSPDPSVKLAGQFSALTEYEVRGRFIRWSEAPLGQWSAWLPVTTDEILLQPGLDFDPFEGFVGFDRLDEDVLGYQDWIGNGLRELQRRTEEFDLWIADQDFGNEYDRQQIRVQVTATFDNARADYTQRINVVAAENFALSERVEELDAEVFDPDTGLPAVASAVDILGTEVSNQDGRLTAVANAVTSVTAASTTGDVNTANFRMTAMSGPTGYSRIGAEARQGGGGSWRSAGWYLEVPNNISQPTRMAVQADQFIVLAGANNTNQVFAVDGTAVRMNVANIGTVTAGIIRSPNSKFIINLSNGSLEWFD